MDRWDVIVVGCGVTGLIAARDVARGGRRVLLIEGRDRLGGRVFTGPIGDMGASWIHDARPSNPILQIARAAHVATVATDYDKVAVFTDGRGRMSDRAVDILEDRFLRVDELAKLQGGLLCRNGDTSTTLQHVTQVAALQAGISQGSKEADELDFFYATEVSHEFGADPAWLSAAHYDEGADVCDTNLLFPEPQGFGAIVSAVVAQVSLFATVTHLMSALATTLDLMFYSALAFFRKAACRCEDCLGGLCRGDSVHSWRGSCCGAEGRSSFQRRRRDRHCSAGSASGRRRGLRNERTFFAPISVFVPLHRRVSEDRGLLLALP
jgi:hypothetical protein